MSEVPTTAWTARVDGDTTDKGAPFVANWIRAGSISHVFTHFSLELEVFRSFVGDLDVPAGHFWSTRDEIPNQALPTVMKKAITAAIPLAFKHAKD